MTPLTPPGYPLDVCCLCCHELNEGGALNGHIPMSGEFFDLLPQGLKKSIISRIYIHVQKGVRNEGETLADIIAGGMQYSDSFADKACDGDFSFLDSLPKYLKKIIIEKFKSFNEDDGVGIAAEDTKDILTLLTKEHKMDLENTKVVLVEKVQGKMRVVAVIENAGVTRSVAPLQAQNIIVPECGNACNPANSGIMCTEVDSYFACGHLQCKQTCMAIGECIVCNCKDFVKGYSFCSDFYLPGHGGDDKPGPYVSPSESEESP